MKIIEFDKDKVYMLCVSNNSNSSIEEFSYYVKTLDDCLRHFGLNVTTVPSDFVGDIKVETENI